MSVNHARAVAAAIGVAVVVWGASAQDAVRAGFETDTEGTLLVGASILAAQIGTPLEVGKFSAEAAGQAVPRGWNPLTFANVEQHTKYELVKDGGRVVVQARSDASASGLIREIRIDPRQYPIIRWRWKVENLIETSDIRRKGGDDYPARLYVAFEYDPGKAGLLKTAKYRAARLLFGDIPIAALNYVWDSKAPVGTFADNAYTDFAKMVVLRIGRRFVGQWVEEERNVYDDYKRAFGEEPPMIKGVAIMTDTDNTKESATAYYGDIVFMKDARAATPAADTTVSHGGSALFDEGSSPSL